MIGLQLLGPYPEVRDIGIFNAHFMFTSKTKKHHWLDIISTMMALLLIPHDGARQLVANVI